MRRFQWGVTSALLALSMGGCLARQVSDDGQNLRSAILDLYTDQAMDNLIRAYENRPFVQLAYSQLSVLDEDKLTGSTSNEADFTRSKTTDLTKAAVMQFLKGMSFAGKFSLGGNGERDRTLSFHADPVTDQNFVYEAYLAFAKNPAFFQCSECKPCGTFRICRRCGNRWYWVPPEAGGEFAHLVLKTSLLAPPAATALGYWETKIDSIGPRLSQGNPVTTPLGNVYKYIITLHDEIPSDKGAMLVIQKGCKRWIPILPVDGTAAKVKKVYTQSDKPLGEIAGATVRFFAESAPNPSPPPSTEQKLQDTLENIRLLLSKSTVVSQ